LLASLLLTRVADADDCPAGSTSKTEDGFTWCQPSVCQNDANCLPSEVCRPAALCVQIGKLDDKHDREDAAQRLVATQRCAPDATCPDSTTCSDMSRCMSKAAAEKMGVLAAPADTTKETPKKSSCGCTVVGERTGASSGLGLAWLALAAAIGSRQIHRRRRMAVSRRDERANSCAIPDRAPPPTLACSVQRRLPCSCCEPS
jgi:MYXO-CTERM domain-containing protein